MKLANEAVHDVRRTEARERKGSEEAAVLKGSRWALLKAPENLRAEERVHLSAVAGLNQRVYRAYLLKEELRALYRCGPRSAPEHLRSWIAWASRSKLRPFVKLGRTLRQYRNGVLATIRLRLLERQDGGAGQPDRRHQASRLRVPPVRCPRRNGLPLLHRSSAQTIHLKLRRGKNQRAPGIGGFAGIRPVQRRTVNPPPFPSVM